MTGANDIPATLHLLRRIRWRLRVRLIERLSSAAGIAAGLALLLAALFDRLIAPASGAQVGTAVGMVCLAAATVFALTSRWPDLTAAALAADRARASGALMTSALELAAASSSSRRPGAAAFVAAAAEQLALTTARLAVPRCGPAAAWRWLAALMLAGLSAVLISLPRPQPMATLAVAIEGDGALRETGGLTQAEPRVAAAPLQEAIASLTEGAGASETTAPPEDGRQRGGNDGSPPAPREGSAIVAATEASRPTATSGKAATPPAGEASVTEPSHPADTDAAGGGAGDSVGAAAGGERENLGELGDGARRDNRFLAIARPADGANGGAASAAFAATTPVRELNARPLRSLPPPAEASAATAHNRLAAAWRAYAEAHARAWATEALP
jgi:hypothetical protein